MVEVAGDEAVEDDDGAEETVDFREVMTPRRSCLYTLRAVYLLWLSRPSQGQNCGRNCCASLTGVARGSVEPSGEAMA